MRYMQAHTVKELGEAVEVIYQAFPNINYRPHPDDVRLLAAFLKDQQAPLSSSLDVLLESQVDEIQSAIDLHQQHF